MTRTWCREWACGAGLCAGFPTGTQRWQGLDYRAYRESCHAAGAPWWRKWGFKTCSTWEYLPCWSILRLYTLTGFSETVIDKNRSIPPMNNVNKHVVVGRRWCPTSVESMGRKTVSVAGLLANSVTPETSRQARRVTAQGGRPLMGSSCRPIQTDSPDTCVRGDYGWVAKCCVMMS